MCTLILALGLFPRFPVVVAANRDEQLDRPSAPPSFWQDEPRVLAPTDLRRGGTWIGVNDRGVFAAVTNRNDIVSQRGKDSRGELALMALDEATAAAAAARIGRLDMRRYNGFHLAIADAQSAFLAYGDGERAPEGRARIEELGSGLHLVSNLGAGPGHAPRAEEIVRVWHGRKLRRDAPHRATWDALLTIHDPAPVADPARMKSMASSCIHRPPGENYGTKSSVFILLDGAWGSRGAEWRWWHRERPEGGHNCAAAWHPELRLALTSE